MTTSEAPTTVEDLIDDIQQWLRYHSDWSVTLDLWSVFGTIGVTVEAPDGTTNVDFGTHLGKRLAWAGDRLREVCTDIHPNGERCTKVT